MAKELLTLKEVKSILKDKDFVVSITSTESVSTALGLLKQHKISSLPVMHQSQERFTSFIDTVDICTFAMEVASLATTPEEAQTRFVSTPCSEVANKSRKNPFYQIQDTDNLKTCLGKMVALSNIHRLPVFNLSGNFVGVLSQSQAVTIINNHIHLFGIANKTVADLRLGIKKVLSVHKTAPIKAAFKLVSDLKVSGVAVVEDEDVLCGNVSASDVKLILDASGAGFRKLESPVSELLTETMAKKRVLSVTPTKLVADVFKLMCTEKIHRVFVVKEWTNQLMGVISLVDLLELVLHYV